MNYGRKKRGNVPRSSRTKTLAKGNSSGIGRVQPRDGTRKGTRDENIYGRAKMGKTKKNHRKLQHNSCRSIRVLLSPSLKKL